MLVIISDLHLTDGTTCETINPGAFRQFSHALATLAESACWRLRAGNCEGAFVPLGRVDVLLLGDILDVMRSSHWLETTRRPWDPVDTLAPDVATITRRILAHNGDALACFRRLRQKNLRIIGSHDGLPYEIPIHFHYLVGNHDWFFHLKGPDWDELRVEIKAALALDNDPLTIFPHTLDESPAIAELCRQHRVHLQHGDIFDPLNYQKDKGRDASSLGDAIVIEIVNGFPERVRRELELPEQHPLYRAFKEADNIRPMLSLPNYFAMAANYFGTPQQKQKVQQLWTEASKPFLDLPFVRSLDKLWRTDTVDMLQLMFSLQRSLPMATQGELAKFIEKFVKPQTYRHEAIAEPAIESAAADFAVYGHSHHAEMVPLSVYEKEGMRREQIYINTGTWRRVHEQTQTLRPGFPFVHFHVMTYAAFYKDDERFGRRHEMWQGSLG